MRHFYLRIGISAAGIPPKAAMSEEPLPKDGLRGPVKAILPSGIGLYTIYLLILQDIMGFPIRERILPNCNSRITEMSRKKIDLTLENVTVEAIAAEGNAITHVDGMVLFVGSAVPGDVVNVRVTKKKKNFMEG